MKLVSETKKFFKTNVQKSDSTDFGIGDMSAIIGILRNNLYSNKIRTPIQEYISNARDAHREIGQKNRRIQIKFPSQISPSFEVRDFGPGVDPDRIKNVFVMYGASTKRATNKQTGGFGIGAKSAWAYTDSFLITTYVDGTKRTYLAHIGDNQNGRLDLQSTVPTDEPNGTKISYDARRHDVGSFAGAIIRTTMFWNDDEYPEFLNAHDYSNMIKGARDAGVARFMGLNFSGASANSYTGSQTNLVIDGIPYPMPDNSDGHLSQLLGRSESRCLNLFIPNGMVVIAASREYVDNSDTTKKALSQIFTAAWQDFLAMQKKWEDDITDVKKLMSSTKKAGGFRMRTSKSFDYVYMASDGSLELREEATIDGEFCRLFNAKIRNWDKSSDRDFDLENQSLEKYYVISGSKISLKDIRAWLGDHSDISSIQLIQIQGQKQGIKSVKNEEGKVVSVKFWKKDSELVKKLIPGVERLGFVNIETKNIEKTDPVVKVKRNGKIYCIAEGLLAMDSDRFVDEDDEKIIPSKPFAYVIGRANDLSVQQKVQEMQLLVNADVIDSGYRILESEFKHIKDDDRFVPFEDVMKNYKPDAALCIKYALRNSWNNRISVDSRLGNAVGYIPDKQHILCLANKILNCNNQVEALPASIVAKIEKSPEYIKVHKVVSDVNSFVSNYFHLLQGSSNHKHNQEYVEWGLDKAAKDGVTLSIPDFLTSTQTSQNVRP